MVWDLGHGEKSTNRSFFMTMLFRVSCSDPVVFRKNMGIKRDCFYAPRVQIVAERQKVAFENLLRGTEI